MSCIFCFHRFKTVLYQSLRSTVSYTHNCFDLKDVSHQTIISQSKTQVCVEMLLLRLKRLLRIPSHQELHVAMHFRVNNIIKALVSYQCLSFHAVLRNSDYSNLDFTRFGEVKKNSSKVLE